MDGLYFVCATTGKKIDAGIESELSTLLKLRGQTVKAYCPHCAETHEWQVGDALLEKAKHRLSGGSATDGEVLPLL
jgi:hypothetical protein